MWLARLVELGLVQRDVPFGESHRGGKRSLYRVADPFLRTWYRFVEPNRSRLEAGDIEAVEHDIDAKWSSHLRALDCRVSIISHVVDRGSTN